MQGISEVQADTMKEVLFEIAEKKVVFTELVENDTNVGVRLLAVYPTRSLTAKLTPTLVWQLDHKKFKRKTSHFKFAIGKKTMKYVSTLLGLPSTWTEIYMPCCAVTEIFDDEKGGKQKTKRRSNQKTNILKQGKEDGFPAASLEALGGASAWMKFAVFSNSGIGKGVICSPFLLDAEADASLEKYIAPRTNANQHTLDVLHDPSYIWEEDPERIDTEESGNVYRAERFIASEYDHCAKDHSLAPIISHP